MPIVETAGFCYHKRKSQTHPMRRSLIPVILASFVLTLAAAPVVVGFFDELDELKTELIAWQTTHAADLSDLMNTLDDLSGPAFTDVNDSDWYGPYVASVSAWGIVSGYRDERGEPTGKFGPANPVTVAEILKMAFEAAQVNEDQCGLVPSLLPQALGHWAAKYVSCGEQNNIRILRDLSVDLNRPATRAEVLAVIHDAFGDTIPPIFANFKDTAGHTLEADIAFAYLRGVVSGDKDALGIETGTFRPNDPVNRAETAKIIYQRLKSDVEQAIASGA